MGKFKKTSPDTILRYLRLLETNKMNVSLTAKEAGVARSTMIRWKKQYWNEYQIRKNEIGEQAHSIEAVKLSTVKEFDVLRNICTKTFKLAVEKSIEILEDEEKLQNFSNKDLIELIKTIGPYCAEKVSLSGAETPFQNGQQRTTYIQNIIRHLNVKSIKHDNEQN